VKKKNRLTYFSSIALSLSPLYITNRCWRKEKKKVLSARLQSPIRQRSWSLFTVSEGLFSEQNLGRRDEGEGEATNTTASAKLLRKKLQSQ
jgi:hypothetical protein